MKKYLDTDHILLLFILITGAVLRFYDFPNLMFTFDEFSALFRTGFKDFGELILKGVVEPDTHPAGVQVFLNYWVKLTGHNEMLIRIPFVLAGIASIGIAYKIGTLWFNPTVGLIAAMFLAFLQYPITYSVFARPYATGLLLSLLVILFWSRAFLEKSKKFLPNVAGYVIAGALCAYNHYFSLFLLGLVGISGLFVVGRQQLIRYLAANILIFILFIPHLNIFFIQLGKGGVGTWLAKPDPLFFKDYLRYALHYSILLQLVSGIFFLITIIFHEKNVMKNMRYRFLLIVWILITWLTGYFYSINVNAVLQPSVLLFTFPLLVILLFSFSKDFRPVYKIAMVSVFFLSSVFSLVASRKHYEVLYNSGYKEIPEYAASIAKEYNQQNVTSIIYLPEKILNYYINKQSLNNLVFYSPGQFNSIPDIRTFLADQNTNYLVLGFSGLDRWEYLPVVVEQYPYLIDMKNWFLCDLFLLSRKPQPDAVPFRDNVVLYGYETDFTKDQPNYQWDLSEGTRGMKIGSRTEYIPLFSGELDYLASGENHLLVLSLELELENPESTALLVSEMLADEELFDWRASSFTRFNSGEERKTRVYLVINLADLLRIDKVTAYNAFIWNKGGEGFHLLNFRLEIWKGNPLLYGLYDRIQD